MNFIAKREDVLSIVEKAVRFTSPNNLNTVLQNLRLNLSDNNLLTISATDMQKHFEGMVIVETLKVGDITVNGKKLLDIIKKSEKKSLIEFDFIGEKLHVKTTSYVYVLPTIHSIIFPEKTGINTKHFFSVDSVELLNCIKKTSFVVSKDSSKIEYTGLHFKVEGSKFEVTGADFTRIATADCIINEQDICCNDFTFSVPYDTILALSKSLSNNNVIKINIGDDKIKFYANDFIISSKLNTKFIKNINRLFDEDYPIVAKFKKTDMVNALKKLKFISSKVTNGVRFSFDGNMVHIETLETLEGKGSTSIACEFIDSPFSIILSAKSLLEMFKYIDSNNIVFHMADKHKCVVIAPENHEHQYILMPITIRED